MLVKDVPQLYVRRVRDQILENMMLSERECRESARDETEVDLETRGRLRRIRKVTEVVGILSQAPLDTEPAENAPQEPGGAPLAAPSPDLAAPPRHAEEEETDENGEYEEGREPSVMQNRQNEPLPLPDHLTYSPFLDRKGSALALRVASAAPGSGTLAPGDRLLIPRGAFTP